MSKNVAIQLKKTDIYRNVSMECEYIGQQDAADAEAYARIIIEEEQYDLLDKWWEEALYMLAEVLSHYLKEESTTTATASQSGSAQTTYDIDFVLVMPDNWRENQKNVKGLVAQYMEDYILTKWLLNHQHEAAEKFVNLAQSAINEIKNTLKMRTRPKM